MLITRKSMMSQVEHTLDVPISVFEYKKGMAARNRGIHIQGAFPMLNQDWSEFIMTGTTPQEWKDMFGMGGEEEEGPEDNREPPELTGED